MHCRIPVTFPCPPLFVHSIINNSADANTAKPIITNSESTNVSTTETQILRQIKLGLILTTEIFHRKNVHLTDITIVFKLGWISLRKQSNLLPIQRTDPMAEEFNIVRTWSFAATGHSKHDGQGRVIKMECTVHLQCKLMRLRLINQKSHILLSSKSIWKSISVTLPLYSCIGNETLYSWNCIDRKTQGNIGWTLFSYDGVQEDVISET